MDNKVRIRKITEQDTDNIIKWRNSPDVNINFIYRRPLTIGSVYLRDIDKEYQKAEYGIFIGEESARGHGIGAAAAKLILEYGFEELKLNRIFLRVFARNERAINSYKKAGFVYEGLFRQDVILDGVKEDVVFMSILREDFESSKVQS